MIETGRNAPCDCGSGKKYKKCCLSREVGMPAVAKSEEASKKVFVKTLTDELFQPMRLYYTIHDEAKLLECFHQLKCMDYDLVLDDWTVMYADEANSIGLKVSPEKVPKHAQPLVIATIYIEKNQAMLVDIRSIERAAAMIKFINKHVPRAAAEITYAAIYNKIISTTHANLNSFRDLDYDQIFDERNITTVDPDKRADELALEVDESSQQHKNKNEALDVIFKNSRERAKKPLPEVEKFPIYYYEEGLMQFLTLCKFRQVIAVQHFLGNKEFTFYDVIQKMFNEKEATLS